MAAALLFCSAPAASPAANPRPLPTRGRHAYRAIPSRGFFPCRASLSPDGSLAVLGPPSPRTAPPMRKPYLREHSCLIFPPPRGRRPLAVIKFLGGAFIGAVPEVTYGNGALLQLLVGSYFSEKIPKANAIVSFNNRPASEAVPYFEQIGPLFSQLMPMMEASPVYSVARNASGDAWKALFDLAGGFLREYDQEAMVSLSKFVDQLPSVMNQVTEGVSEFKPTPPENREFCKNSYSVPNTLLVKFSVDAIDDTDIVEDVLRPRIDSIGGQIKKVILSGTHLTPCIQDVKWQVGSEYTPADAIAQGLKSLALSETRVLSRTIADWFTSL